MKHGEADDRLVVEEIRRQQAAYLLNGLDLAKEIIRDYLIDVSGDIHPNRIVGCECDICQRARKFLGGDYEATTIQEPDKSD